MFLGFFGIRFGCFRSGFRFGYGGRFRCDNFSFRRFNRRGLRRRGIASLPRPVTTRPTRRALAARLIRIGGCLATLFSRLRRVTCSVFARAVCALICRIWRFYEKIRFDTGRRFFLILRRISLVRPLIRPVPAILSALLRIAIINIHNTEIVFRMLIHVFRRNPVARSVRVTR